MEKLSQSQFTQLGDNVSECIALSFTFFYAYKCSLTWLLSFLTLDCIINTNSKRGVKRALRNSCCKVANKLLCNINIAFLSRQRLEHEAVQLQEADLALGFMTFIIYRLIHNSVWVQQQVTKQKSFCLWKVQYGSPFEV